MSLIREALAVALLLPDPTSRGSEAGSGQPHQTPETTDKASGSPRSDSSVKAAPRLFAPDNRRRLSASGLRTFLAIADLWELTDEQRRLILRSEEHTSELQSLMRTSYAIFCLKKNIKNAH